MRCKNGIGETEKVMVLIGKKEGKTMSKKGVKRMKERKGWDGGREEVAQRS